MKNIVTKKTTEMVLIVDGKIQQPDIGLNTTNIYRKQEAISAAHTAVAHYFNKSWSDWKSLMAVLADPPSSYTLLQKRHYKSCGMIGQL
jgi:hypothetical protein